MGTWVNVVVTDAVPEQVAVPLDSVAEVGAGLALTPPAEIASGVPLAMVFAPVRVAVAMVPEPVLKPLRVQVCPAVPLITEIDELIAAVPEQVAVPLESVAVVG